MDIDLVKKASGGDVAGVVAVLQQASLGKINVDGQVMAAVVGATALGHHSIVRLIDDYMCNSVAIRESKGVSACVH